jgi:lactoylglutathione lyase
MQTKAIIWAGLTVENLEKEVIFFRDVIGLSLKRQGEGWAHFDAGGGALFELTAGGLAAPEPKDFSRQPLVIGFLVDHLDQEVAELKTRGVNFLGEIESFKSQRWVTFSDPEGNLLELKEIYKS